MSSKKSYLSSYFPFLREVGQILDGNDRKDFMSYENAALGYYLYRELLLTQFLEQLPKVHTSSSDPLVLQTPAKTNLEKCAWRGNS